MTFHDLVCLWLEWRAGRADGSVGYAASRFNLMMAGSSGIRAGGAVSGVPFDVDADCVCSVFDRAFCQLAKFRQDVLIAEYGCEGTQPVKARGLKVSERTYRNRLAEARAQLLADPAVKRLLKNA